MMLLSKAMKVMLGFIGVLILLAPLTVLAQNKVVVIPLFGDDAKPLKNIVTVAKANGMFTDPVAAVNSITDASEINPYLVVIGPGVYQITSTLVMKPSVHIIGSGENVTILSGTISGVSPGVSSAIVSGSNDSSLSSLKVENAGGGQNSIGLFNHSTSPRVSNVRFDATGGIYNCGVYNVHYSGPTMTDVTAWASGGTENYAFYNEGFSSAKMTNVTARVSGGTVSVGIYNSSSAPIMTNVNAEAAAGTYTIGIHNADGSSPVMVGISVRGSSGGEETYGVYNGNSSNPTMTNVIATASGGPNNYGVRNENSYPTMTDVTTRAFGGAFSAGIYNYQSSPSIRRSTIQGDTAGLYSSGGYVMVSQSTIIGGVDGTGTKKCVASDNGSGEALNSSCSL